MNHRTIGQGTHTQATTAVTNITAVPRPHSTLLRNCATSPGTCTTTFAAASLAARAAPQAALSASVAAYSAPAGASFAAMRCPACAAAHSTPTQLLLLPLLGLPAPAHPVSCLECASSCQLCCNALPCLSITLTPVPNPDAADLLEVTNKQQPTCQSHHKHLQQQQLGTAQGPPSHCKQQVVNDSDVRRLPTTAWQTRL